MLGDHDRNFIVESAAFDNFGKQLEKFVFPNESARWKQEFNLENPISRGALHRVVLATIVYRSHDKHEGQEHLISMLFVSLHNFSMTMDGTMFYCSF